MDIDFEGLIGDYHDNCHNYQLTRFLTDQEALTAERLRLMDHRREYIADSQLKRIILEAYRERLRDGQNEKFPTGV